MSTIQMQATAYVLAAISLGKGDIDVTLEVIEGMAGYESDRPGLSSTLRAVARLARRYIERERTALGAGAVRG